MNIGNDYLEYLEKAKVLLGTAIEVRKQLPHFGIYWFFKKDFESYESAYDFLSDTAVTIFQTFGVSPRLSCFVDSIAIPFYVKFYSEYHYYYRQEVEFTKYLFSEGYCRVAFRLTCRTKRMPLQPIGLDFNGIVQYDIRQIIKPEYRAQLTDLLFSDNSDNHLLFAKMARGLNPKFRIYDKAKKIPIASDSVGYRLAIYSMYDISKNHPSLKPFLRY